MEIQLGQHSNWARVWKIRFSILGRGKKFFAIQNVQRRSETEPVNIYRGFFLRGHKRSGLEYYDYSAPCITEVKNKLLYTVACRALR